MVSKILTWFKDNLLVALIAILVIVIVLQKCERDAITSPEIIVKTDTIWKKVTDTIVTKPKLIKTIVGKPEIKIKYVADPNYNRLVKQYNGLVDKYTEQNIHKDSIKIDDIGYVNIIDTVSENLIVGRKTSYSLKYPTITTTITKLSKPVNQVYYGGGVEVSPVPNTVQLNAGFMFKDKKDQIIGLYGGIDTQKNFHVGVNLYWKIKLHK